MEDNISIAITRQGDFAYMHPVREDGTQLESSWGFPVKETPVMLSLIQDAFLEFLVAEGLTPQELQMILRAAFATWMHRITQLANEGQDDVNFWQRQFGGGK